MNRRVTMRERTNFISEYLRHSGSSSRSMEEPWKTRMENSSYWRIWPRTVWSPVFWISRWEHACILILPVKQKPQASDESVPKPPVPVWVWGSVAHINTRRRKVITREQTNMWAEPKILLLSPVYSGIFSPHQKLGKYTSTSYTMSSNSCKK